MIYYSLSTATPAIGAAIAPSRLSNAVKKHIGCQSKD